MPVLDYKCICRSSSLWRMTISLWHLSTSLISCIQGAIPIAFTWYLVHIHTHTCTQKAEDLSTAKVGLHLINAHSVHAMCGEWIVGSKKVLNIRQVVCRSRRRVHALAYGVLHLGILKIKQEWHACSIVMGIETSSLEMFLPICIGNDTVIH